MDKLDLLILFDLIKLFSDLLQGIQTEFLTIKDESQAVKEFKFFHQEARLLSV
ncbi:MAG: hypothetical protein IJI25_00265 [Eubacterium sp.]|nr:hypothetical protein [Eubacterium sp.]